MDTLDRSTLTELAGHDGWPAASIYLPTHRAGSETQQDRIRLKNLIREAEEALSAHGMRSPDVTSLLAPANDLLADSAFWRDGFEGIAIFISSGTSRVFRTSRPLPEQVRLSSRFLVRPLIPALGPDLRFFVLALSKNRVRVLEGTADEVHELEPGNIPQGLAEALKYDDYEQHVQFHSRTPAAASGRGRRSAVFHGHGGSADASKKDLLRYFRQVDRELVGLLAERNTPLLLAGVDYLHPIYREANSYPRLLAEAITGNPDELPAAEIHAEALELLRPHIDGALSAAIATFAEKRDAGRASSEIGQIVPAAFQGRIDTLLVTETEPTWGTYDPETGSAAIRTEPLNGDIDLIDRAAAETILHGGTVHVVPAEGVREATGGAEAAAILRY